VRPGAAARRPLTDACLADPAAAARAALAAVSARPVACSAASSTDTTGVAARGASTHRRGRRLDRQAGRGFQSPAAVEQWDAEAPPYPTDAVADLPDE